MNTYYLKKYRKDAKKRIRIIFSDNEYHVVKYNTLFEAWELINKRYPKRNHSTPDLCVAKNALAYERRRYILGLVKTIREIKRNKELAKL